MKRFFKLIAVFVILIIFLTVFIVKNKNLSDRINKNDKIQSKDLFAEHYDEAEKIMQNMTIEEKVSQMFLVTYTKKGVINQIRKHNPGGYILFTKDFEDKTKEQIINELKRNQEASKIKLIFGVDEEGGKITRVSNYKELRDTKFLSVQELFEKGGLQAILEDSREKSEFLKSLGLNMNLAPVVDVVQNKDSYMYERAYGKNAQETAIYARELINTMNKSNMISVMKHFPGYGDNVDTHNEIAIDNRDYQTFEEIDFLPFKSGIEAGAPAILVSHNIVTCIDGEKPASLSEKVIKILREELGFSGIIITDDLEMDALDDYTENGEAAVQAILAGNDMIISTYFVKQKKQILSAIEEGRISEELINTAVRRILSFKIEYGII